MVSCALAWGFRRRDVELEKAGIAVVATLSWSGPIGEGGEGRLGNRKSPWKVAPGAWLWD